MGKEDNFSKGKKEIDSTDSELQLALDELGGFLIQLSVESLCAEPMQGFLDHQSPHLTQLWQSQGEVRNSNQRGP